MTISIATSQQAVNRTHKVDLNIFDCAAPSIEAKDLVGKIDDLLSSEIVNLSSSIARTC